MKSISKKIMSLCICTLIMFQTASTLVLATGREQVSVENNQTASNKVSSDESFGIDTSTPTSFDPDDGVHPYTKDVVNLNPINELVSLEWSTKSNTYDFSLYNYNEKNPSEPSKSYLDPSVSGPNFFDYKKTNEMYNKQGTSLSSQNTSKVSGSISDYTQELNGLNGVAYDATGSGQDDHIAYYGFNRDYYNIPTLITTKADEDPYSRDAYRLNLSTNVKETYKYITNDANAAFLNGFNSIVAGDFDGDGKDSIVMYDPQYGMGIIEELEGEKYLDLNSYATFGEGSKSGDIGYASDNVLSSIFKEMTGITLKELVSETPSNTFNAFRNMPYVHLAAGDVTGDNKDELVITVSFNEKISTEMKAKMKSTSSFIIILEKDENKIWQVQKSYSMDSIRISEKSDDENFRGYAWDMHAASSYIGDYITGDSGAKEIITVGESLFSNRDSWASITPIIMPSYYIAVTTTVDKNGKYNIPLTTYNSKYYTMGNFLTSYIYENSRDEYEVKLDIGAFKTKPYNSTPVSLGMVAFDGLGTQEYIAVEGNFYKYTDGVFHNVSFSSSNKVTQVFKNQINTNLMRLSQPTIGNFYGDKGEESILYISMNPGDDSYYVIGFHKRQSENANVMKDGLLSSKWKSTYNRPTLVSADYDDDAVLAEFESKEYSYSDPEVLAILEVAPYFKNLDYSADIISETIFGMSSGSSSGTGTSSSTAASIIAGFDFEDPFGVMGVEVEVTYTDKMTKDFEETKTYSTTTSFVAGEAESHQIVMLATPVQIFNYKLTLPNGNQQEMSLQVPDSQKYSMISIDEYNAIADSSAGKYPLIGDDILTSTPGDPTTYRNPNSISKPIDIANEHPIETGHGNGHMEEEIAKGKESQTAKTVSHSIDGEATAKIWHVKVGGGYGQEWENTTSTTDLSELTFGGIVGQIPDYASKDYGFSWQFIRWDETLKNSKGDSYTVPVLGYYVEGVRSKLTAPVLSAQPVDESSIELSWVKGPNSPEDVEYEIYRVVNNQYFRLFEDQVITEENFTVSNLSPNSTYDFAIKAVTKGDESYYSNIASAKTYADSETAGVKIISSPTDQMAYVNDNVTFSVDAVSDPIAGQTLRYQWQKLSTNDLNWENIDGATSKDYTFKANSIEEDGTLYRCAIINILSSNPSSVLSDNATLTVKPLVDTSVSLVANNFSDGDSIELNDSINVTATVQDKLDSTLISNATVRFSIVSDNSEDTGTLIETVDVKTDENGNANIAINLEDAGLEVDGKYKVFASVIHTGNLAESVSNEIIFTVSKPSTEHYLFDNLEALYYYEDIINPIVIPEDPETIPTPDPSSVMLKAYLKDGASYSHKPISQDGVEDLSKLTLMPGEYMIKAFENGKIICEGETIVLRKSVDVFAPVYSDEIENIKEYTPQGIITLSETINNPLYGSVEDGYENIFKLELSRRSDGYYNSTNFTENHEVVGDFLSKYSPVFKDSILNVKGLSIHNITYEVLDSNGNTDDNNMIIGNSDSSGMFRMYDKVHNDEEILLRTFANDNGTPVVKKWIVNGEEITESNMKNYGMETPNDLNLILNGIQEDTHIVAVVSHNNYNIVAHSSDNGEITPSGDVVVSEGEDKEFKFIPDDGYEVDKVVLNGEEVETQNNSYTVENVKSDMIITVSFKEAAQEPTQPTEPTTDPVTQPTTNTTIDTNPTDKSQTNTPSTGDNFPIYIFTVLLILSFVTVVLMVSKKRKDN